MFELIRANKRRSVALSSPFPPSARVATERAVAICSAEPGTEKMRNVDSAAARTP